MLPVKDMPREQLETMLSAGAEISECYRVLKKGGANIVSELLKGAGTFYEWNHYPDGDTYDGDTHSQYYYHAHREGEHGHFHTFLRRKGMPEGCHPVANPTAVEWPQGDDELSHLIAISMDAYGFPIRIFTTNRWVTGENWFAAADVIKMLDRFEIDHAFPSWPVNRWVTALIRLFRPEIAQLIEQRDVAIAKHAEKVGQEAVFEDRDLDATGAMDIDVDARIAQLKAALGLG